MTPEEACRRLKDAGADVVGLNCIRGPRTLLPLIEAIRARWRGPIAALPVPRRTHEDQPSLQSLRDPGYRDLPDGRPIPTALDPFTCNRYEIADFARAARERGVDHLGVPRRSGADRRAAANGRHVQARLPRR